MRPILYPFYYEVCKANPGREVWLIEDRASPHEKAYNVEVQLREEQGIRSCINQWPGKSPDLNMIEPCWGDLKDDCHPHWRNVVGSGESAKTEARRTVTAGWKLIEESCRNHARGFLERLQQVEQRGGNNNVRG